MGVAPLAHGGEHGPEVPALGRQPVLVARRVLGVGDLDEDAGVDQLRQPLLEDVARDPEAPLEVLESGHTEERVADDEHRPPFPDDLEALRH